jgi:tetratricopeptide (TPR) repeat protein
MLAHLRLNEGRNEEAIAMLRQSLAAQPDNGTVIDAVAGGYFRAHDLEGMVATVGPVYDPARHETQTGMALLQAYLALQRREEDEALLSRMEALSRPDLRPQLALFRQQFTTLANC